MDVKKFIRVNGLRQKELADYLGVAEGSVSRVVNGKNSFSDHNLYKILHNPYGWDVSMLMMAETQSGNVNGNGNIAFNGSHNHIAKADDELLDALRKNIALLEDQVAELKRDKEELREWIKEMTRQRKGSD